MCSSSSICTFTFPRPPRLAPATCSALAENIAVRSESKSATSVKLTAIKSLQLASIAATLASTPATLVSTLDSSVNTPATSANTLAASVSTLG